MARILDIVENILVGVLVGIYVLAGILRTLVAIAMVFGGFGGAVYGLFTLPDYLNIGRLDSPFLSIFAMAGIATAALITFIIAFVLAYYVAPKCIREELFDLF